MRMNIFTKLAMDHFMVGGDSPLISGTNDLRPLDPPAPSIKMKEDAQGPMTDLTMERHLDQTQGQLSRAFDNYIPSIKDFQVTIGQLMSANIERISGSSAASQALLRHAG